MVCGLLARTEVQALDRGDFPSTLAHFGVPDPNFEPCKIPKPSRGTPAQDLIRAPTMLIGPRTGGGQTGSSRSTARRPADWNRHNDDEDEERLPKRITAKGRSKRDYGSDEDSRPASGGIVAADKLRRMMDIMSPVPLVGKPHSAPARDQSLNPKHLSPPVTMKRMTIDEVAKTLLEAPKRRTGNQAPTLLRARPRVWKRPSDF